VPLDQGGEGELGTFPASVQEPIQELPVAQPGAGPHIVEGSDRSMDFAA